MSKKTKNKRNKGGSNRKVRPQVILPPTHIVAAEHIETPVLDDLEVRQRPLTEQDKEQEQERQEKPKQTLQKSKLRRVRFWDNGIEMYLPDSRKVTIFEKEDGVLVIETKKSLKADEDFADFVPVKIDLEKRWGARVATCQFTMSKEAVLSLLMGLNELIKNGTIK